MRGGHHRGIVVIVSGLLVGLLALATTSGTAWAAQYGNVGSFGNAPGETTGSADGKFNNPSQVAVGPGGDVYVADTGNNRVQVLEPNSTCSPECASYLLQFGDTAPQGIAVDPSTGDVYTTHLGTNEVQTYANNPFGAGVEYRLIFEGQATTNLAGNASAGQVRGALEALSTIGSGNVEVSGTSTTKTVTFTAALASKDVPALELEKVSDGSTLTATTSTNGVPGAVAKYLPSENPPTASTTYSPDGSFSSPALTGNDLESGGTGRSTRPPFGGIAVSPESGDFYLTLGDSVQRYSPSGAPQGSPFNGPDAPGGPLTAAADVAVDEAGDVFVADIVSSGSVRLLRFGSAGAYEATLTPPPENPNALKRGAAVAVDPAAGQAFATASPGAIAEGVEVCHYAADVQTACFGTAPVTALAYLRGIAASGTTPDRVYAVGFDESGFFGTPGPPRVQVFEELLPPTVSIDPVAESAAAPCPTGITATSACFSGEVNPEGSDAQWWFEYREVGTTSWLKAPAAPGDAGPGTDPVPVHETAEGLEPNTSYEVKLVATNNGGALSEASPALTFRTHATAATVETLKAWSVSASAATLVGAVNPHNSALLDCHFVYGTSAGYGQSVPCAGTLPSGPTSELVVANVANLSPALRYHFQLIADDGTGGPRPGGDATLTTRATAESDIPARGYELVSASDTNGIAATPDLSSPGGDEFAYKTFIPAPGAGNGGGEAWYRAVRAADGSWSQHYLGSPPPPSGWRSLAMVSLPLFSEDSLATTAFGTAEPLDPDDQNGQPGDELAGRDTYLASASGEVTWLSRDPAIPPGTPQTDPAAAYKVVYVSADGDRVLFESSRHLSPVDASTGGLQSLYEYADGALSLVGQIPGSGATRCGDKVGLSSCVGPEGGSVLGSGVAQGSLGTVADSVSSDGERVMFEAAPNGTSRPQLFVRIRNEETVQVSAGAPGAPPITVAKDVVFGGADSGGDRLFFTSSSPLTPDSTAPGTESGPGTGPSDLYTYSVGSRSLRDLTPSAGGAGVERVYGVSDDGRRVYFTSAKRLNGAGELTESGGGLAGVAGGPNLYLAELTGSELSVRFIATLDRVEDGNGDESGLIWSPRFQEVDLDPSGSVIAFRDRLDLVPGRRTGGYPQVYVYEANRHELSCASCPRSGGAPDAGAKLTPSLGKALDSETSQERPLGELTGSGINAAGPHARDVSTTGSVVFQTSTALSPADTNGQIDVYEWHGNQVGLISAGIGSAPSILADASADGQTVFFASPDALAAGAQAGIRHIYAARVGGGFSAATPAPPCTGQDCRAPGVNPPQTTSAGSNRFAGPGNVKVGRAGARCRDAKGKAQKLRERAGRLRRRATHTSQQRRARLLRREAQRVASRATRVVRRQCHNRDSRRRTQRATHRRPDSQRRRTAHRNDRQRQRDANSNRRAVR